MAEWLFLAVPWGCLRFVIVVIPDHTHLLFLKPLKKSSKHWYTEENRSTYVNLYPILKVSWVAKIRNRYNQVSHLTQDTTRESDTNTIKHHERQPRGQPFPSR